MENTERLLMKAKELCDRYGIGWAQFHSCKAYISEEIDDRYILIKSYHTIVGIADTETKEICEIGKYSRTTSKQFTQICNQRFRNYNRLYIDGRV